MNANSPQVHKQLHKVGDPISGSIRRKQFNATKNSVSFAIVAKIVLLLLLLLLLGVSFTLHGIKLDGPRDIEVIFEANRMHTQLVIEAQTQHNCTCA